MSFRSRLLLFFMIIVIVPMIAVALVLFSITADSETGKADAAIAQGLRAAFAVYDGDRAKARPALEAVARHPVVAARQEGETTPCPRPSPDCARSSVPIPRFAGSPRTTTRVVRSPPSARATP